jgi:branched-chain amino acid transport system substrate-binding protein
MRKILLGLAALLLVTGCGETAGNMSREVSSWFRTDPETGRMLSDPATPAATPAQTGEAPATPAPAAVTGRPSRVGILLPLSGPNEKLGKDFLDAANMAVLDLAGDGFELLPKDAANGASAAAQAALAEGAEVLIGPVFSAQVAEVKAQAAKAPVLALSNDISVAGNGIYVLGFDPASQVKRIMAYAKKKNLHRMVVLAPSTPYGDIAVEQVRRSGMKVVTYMRYPADAAGMRKTVETLAARRGEFDTLFVPEGGQALVTVASVLASSHLTAKDVTLLGTGLWDDTGVSSIEPLQGGFYAAPDPTQRQAFAQRFEQVYGRAPSRLASLAYDATALVAVLAKNNQLYGYDTLTNPSGFSGLDGLFRLNRQGVAERGLAILSVNGNGPQIVEPAPDKF